LKGQMLSRQQSKEDNRAASVGVNAQLEWSGSIGMHGRVKISKGGSNLEAQRRHSAYVHFDAGFSFKASFPTSPLLIPSQPAGSTSLYPHHVGYG